MSGRWAAAWAMLPDRLAAHLGVSAAALVLALLVAAPLVLAMARRPGLRAGALAVAGVIQTVPALALLALFYPLLLALSALTERLAGFGVPALGFLPSLLALALYALLPLLRGGADGLASVAPEVREAADGVGMTRRQKLLLVELPIAAPIVLGGIRTAAVWTIGAATLATTVGQRSLGDLIFAGLQTEDWTLVAVGCLAAAGLAIAVDAALGLVEGGVARRQRTRWAAGLALLAVIGLAGLVPGLARPATAGRAIVIGAKNFGEQYILAELVARRLRAAGYRVETRTGLGSAVVYRALAAGDIDVYVDYSGTLWSGVLGRTDVPRRADLLAQLGTGLARRDHVTMLGSLGFENAYALAMPRARAQQFGLKTLDDLAARAPTLRLATDLEFQSRAEWASLQKVYGLRFASLRAITPTLMWRALSGGDADLLAAFSSDGRIAALDLVTVADPKGALPTYDAVLLASPAHAGDARFLAALRPLVGAIDVAAMRAANWQVDRETDKRDPAAVAAAMDAAIRR